MSSYNICYWTTPEKAWNDLDVDQEYLYGDNRVVVTEKRDNQITIEYYDGHIRRLSKKQALRCLRH